MGAMILAEVGDFNNFSSPDKLLAYAGLSPSTYQSGQLTNCYAHMEKRGSRYLRYALFNAAKYVCNWDATFGEYLAKKRAEGKHYNVAISMLLKVSRLIFALRVRGRLFHGSLSNYIFFEYREVLFLPYSFRGTILSNFISYFCVFGWTLIVSLSGAVPHSFG